MKKVVSYIASFAMILGLLFVPNVEANAADVSLAVSASTVNIGDNVTVTVTVPEGYTATIDLGFSSDVLSFVSASSEVGANGSNVRINIGKYSPAGSNSVSVTFKANTSGTATFSANVASAVDDNTVEDVVIGGASTTITVQNQAVEQPTPPPADNPAPPAEDPAPPAEEPKSADNSLSSLKLSVGSLSPSFKKNVTKYTATVDFDVTKVVVSAKTSNAKATIESVTGNGTVNLEVGENKIQIVVIAENGVKATYTIVVTRLPEGESTSSESESESESETQTPPSTQEVLQWNGQVLESLSSVPKQVIPADFSTSTVMINNVKTPCITFDNADLKVLYLTDVDGNESFYVYDETQQMIYPFVKIESETNYVMVLLPDEANAPAPESYQACTLSIEGKGVINAYQFIQPVKEPVATGLFGAEIVYAAEPVATDFYLVYCMNNAGEKGWYVYDSVEGTFQRYLGSVHTPPVAPEDVTGENVGNVENPENTEAYNKLVAELENAKQMQMIIICVAVFVVIVLVIIIVNLILRNRSDEDYDEFDDDYDDEDYDDDEYYDEYEFEADEDTTVENEADDEMEIEFYEMSEETVDATSENSVEVSTEENDDEIEIEFYEMPQEAAGDTVDESEDEIEIEFYEMTSEESAETIVEKNVEATVEENDEDVEVEFYDMEALLIQEAIASEEDSKKEEKIPKKESQVKPVKVENTYVDNDDDDDDLEFIDLD